MATGLVSEVMELRSQGLPDTLVRQELQGRGYPGAQVEQAIMQADTGAGMPTANYAEQAQYAQPASAQPVGGEGNIYERMEEIAEGLIDEKWDELIAEVKKIVEWKEMVEQAQRKLQNDVDKLKEDFNLLHQGVLGKLEDYDTRMRDVGTELKAVGKVFKDVVPVFVENVKELRDITGKVKKG